MDQSLLLGYVFELEALLNYTFSSKQSSNEDVEVTDKQEAIWKGLSSVQFSSVKAKNRTSALGEFNRLKTF